MLRKIKHGKSGKSVWALMSISKPGKFWNITVNRSQVQRRLLSPKGEFNFTNTNNAMHQPHEIINECKNRPGLFRVGWMHLLGLAFVISFSLLLGVCLFLLGYSGMMVQILSVSVSMVLSPLVWNGVDRFLAKQEARNRELFRQELLQKDQLEQVWQSNEYKPYVHLSFSEVQSLFFQCVDACCKQHPKQADQIPKGEQYSVLRDICEESWWFLYDKFHWLLHRGFRSIGHYFSSLFHSQRRVHPPKVG